MPAAPASTAAISTANATRRRRRPSANSTLPYPGGTRAATDGTGVSGAARAAGGPSPGCAGAPVVDSGIGVLASVPSSIDHHPFHRVPAARDRRLPSHRLRRTAKPFGSRHVVRVVARSHQSTPNSPRTRRPHQSHLTTRPVGGAAVCASTGSLPLSGVSLPGRFRRCRPRRVGVVPALPTGVELASGDGGVIHGPRFGTHVDDSRYASAMV